MLLSYREEREGQQRESVLSESETYSVSTPASLSLTRADVTHGSPTAFLSSFHVGYIYK